MSPDGLADRKCGLPNSNFFVYHSPALTHVSPVAIVGNSTHQEKIMSVLLVPVFYLTTLAVLAFAFAMIQGELDSQEKWAVGCVYAVSCASIFFSLPLFILTQFVSTIIFASVAFGSDFVTQRFG